MVPHIIHNIGDSSLYSLSLTVSTPLTPDLESVTVEALSSGEYTKRP